jgi:hypothetical protein
MTTTPEDEEAPTFVVAIQAAWDAIEAAQRNVDDCTDPAARMMRMEYRNGLLDAYATWTGRDPEATYEALQDVSIAYRERCGEATR